MRALLFALFLATADTSTAATWHVDPVNGDDTNTGGEIAPLKTLMAAAKRVNPGDTVLAHPGVYFEHVKLERGGSKEAPVTFRALEGPEKTIITGAHRPLREGKLKWENMGDDLWRLPLPEEPATLLCDDLNLYRYPTLDELRRFTVDNVALQKKPGPGPKHGWAWEEGHIYLRLHVSGRYGVTDPNQRTLKASPARGPGFRGDEIDTRTRANFLLFTPGPSHVIIEGFTFESPGFCGVWVRHGSAAIRGCRFIGCRTGVRGWDRPEKKPRQLSVDVLVEKCEFTEHPTYEDVVECMTETIALPAAQRKELARFFWWHRKGGPYTSEIGLVAAAGKQWTIRDNHIHNTFEGLGFMSLSWSENAEVYGNRFERIVDNAIETENHARSLRAHDNVIVDCFEPFSYQPLGGEPWPTDIIIERNTVSFTGKGAVLWGHPDLGWRPGCCKVYVLPELKEIPGSLIFRENLIWFPGGNLLSINRAAATLRGVRFERNVIVVRSPGGTEDGTPPQFYEFIANHAATVSKEDRSALASLAANGGTLHDDVTTLGIERVDENSGVIQTIPGSAAALFD